MKREALLLGVIVTLCMSLSLPSAHATTAVPGPDQWVYGGDVVLLDGSASVTVDTFHWEQVVVGDEPSVTLENPDAAEVEFTAPSPLQVGVVLTFRLTVTGPGGTDSAETHVNVRATNPPQVPPSNLRVMPLDLGPGGLGFRMEWDPLVDAEEYQIGLKLDSTYVWLEVIQQTSYQSAGMLLGDTRTLAVQGRNKFGTSDEPEAIAEVSYTPMPNLARPASLGGTREPLPPVQGKTYLISRLAISGMNDITYDDHNDSREQAISKTEDFWGYLWPQPLFFDHIVYFTGDMFSDGGWFTSLKVQYTQDGTTWNDVPILEIYPEYDFTDDAAGKQPFTRYDIFIPTLRGIGIRIYGTAGGTATFTSIAELEVFGDQTRPGPVVEAIGRDAEFDEGSTATLDGSQSSSTAGPIVHYQWQQISGPAVAIQNADSAIATFETPMVDQDEVLVFSLTVSDGTNEDVDNDVRITVRNVEVPETKADAGPDQVVFEGNLVTLDGSASTSASSSLTYLWTQTRGTDVDVTGSPTATVTFTAPIVGDTTEELTFRLQVDDGLGHPDSVSTDEVVIEVRKSAGVPPSAVPGEDQWVYCGDMVTLDGSQSIEADTYHWEQVVVGDEPSVTLSDPDPADGITTFTGPPREIGYALTLRLTVTGPGGTDSAETNVNVRAANPPKLAPQNLRALPLDLGPAGLGFRLVWDPVFDAEEYQIALKVGGEYFWIDTTASTHYDVKGMLEGMERTVALRGENRFSDPFSPDPAHHGVRSEDVTYVGMPNLARPASLGGTRPPLPPVLRETYVISHYDIGGMNNTAYDDHNDSWNGLQKEEDFWGYLWSEPLFFDHVVYLTGDMFSDGGWFTSLKVQYTDDGTTWKDAPILEVFPEYDFTDDPAGKQPFTRYDIFIPTLRGIAVRIYGTPGGTATFTSISELEVFGDQMRSLVVQGLDAEFQEGNTATLEGRFCFSSRGEIVSYQWEQVSGPPIVIQNANSPAATFVAPLVDQDEVLVFRLTASDGVDALSDDDVRIIVKNVEAPKTEADAGPDQSVLEGTLVTVDGSASTSASGSLTYFWTQTGGPDVGATGSTNPIVAFTAPTVWDHTEELTFQLQVDDGLGQPDSISTDEVVVQVRNALAWPAYPLGPGYFKDLLHLGQHPTDLILFPLNINSDSLAAFGGEAHQNPYPGLEYDFTGTGVWVTTTPMVWTPIHSEDGFFGNELMDDFQQIYHIYIISFDERDARFHFRHGDEVRAWNNGLLVINRDGWDTGREQTEDFVLYKGLNSMTFKFKEAGGANHFAAGIADPSNQPFTDLLYSFGLVSALGDACAARQLPASFQPEHTVEVKLAVRVNPDNRPASVNIVEEIPDGLSESHVDAPGAVVAGGRIVWNLTGPQVENTTLTYSLNVPSGTTPVLHFSGTLSFAGTTVDIFGDDVLYPIPSEPRHLKVEMVAAAHLSWSSPLTEGATQYTIYRSVNGGPWEKIATVADTTYVDSSVLAGETYSYQVSATSIRQIEGPSSLPSAPVSLPAMEIREAENFNYGGGLYPWTEGTNIPAVEATAADDLDPGKDFWHPNKGGPPDYRPLDAIGIETVLDPGTTDKYHTNIAWTIPTSWWRYTFDGPEAGWIKLDFRVACPTGGTFAAYWDEVLVGEARFSSGDWHEFTWVALEDSIQTTTGEHTLRVTLVSGQMNFDKIAIGYNWPPPPRETIWGDDFDSYTANSEVFDPAVGGWTKQTAGFPDGAWQLWNTAGELMNGVDPDIAGMEDGYMISNSDMSGEGAPLNEQLISPQIDCTDYTGLRLDFNKHYRIYPLDPDHPQIAEVDIRVFDAASGWGDWINLLHLDFDSVPTDLDPAILSDPEVFDLSAYDGKTIQLRFHYYDAEWDYWFAVDSIRVSGVPTGPPPPRASIGKDGDIVSLGWEEFGDGEYTVEYADDLNPGTWQSPPGTWPTSSTNWTDNSIRGTVHQRFYRVESDGIYTDPVGFVGVVAPEGGLVMISVPLAAADNMLNGDPGCIGDMIKEHLVGGLGPATADIIWKWDAGTQSYKSAFLIGGKGPDYDGKWWDPDTNDFSTMTLDAGEAFWLQRQ